MKIICRFAIFVLTLVWACLVASAALRADVEKISPGGKKAGDKEAEPEPELGKPGEPGKRSSEEDHLAIHRKLEAEGQENLKEIARLMEKIRSSLSQKDTGDSTQGNQQEVVKKIQELIDKIEKGCGKAG